MKLELGTDPIYIGDGIYVLIESNYQFKLYTTRSQQTSTLLILLLG